MVADDFDGCDVDGLIIGRVVSGTAEVLSSTTTTTVVSFASNKIPTSSEISTTKIASTTSTVSTSTLNQLTIARKDGSFT